MRRVRLCFPERVARIARARWAHHTIHADLPAERWAERDGGHLVQERDYVLVDVGALKVAAASAALARDAL